MQFHPKFPFGKGVWIWNLPDCMGGDLNKITAQCLEYGISYVIVKCGDGINTWDQFTQDVVDAFHNAGIKIYSWSYVYGDDPLREAAIAMWALDMGVDGHVFDAEGEYEGKPDQATSMLQAVRNHSASAFLAYAPFPIIDLHTSYPYIEFGKFCNAVMPQIYWGDFQKTPLDAVNWMYDNFSRWQETWQQEGYGDSVQPIIPLGQAYDNLSVTPPYTSNASDIVEFISVVRGYMSVNFWSFQHILGEPIWEAIRDNNVKPAPVAPTTNISPQINQNGTSNMTSTTPAQVPVATDQSSVNKTSVNPTIPTQTTSSTQDSITIKQTSIPVFAQKKHVDYLTGAIISVLKALHLQ